MNVLITGSNGFVGSALMCRLQNEGHKVIGIDISAHCDDKAHPETLLGDIRNPNDLQQVHRNFLNKHSELIDLVIHCAASKDDFGVSEEEYYSHNELGTKVLIEFIEKEHIKKLIYFSSVSVYGHPPSEADEENSFNPDNPYGASKLAGEMHCTNWHKRDSQNELIVLRPVSIFGPENYANMYKMIDMMHRRPLFMIGDGNYYKTIISRDSIIDITLFSLKIMKTGAQYYNCSDKPYTTVIELMRIISRNPAFKIPKFQIPVWFAVFIGKLFDIPANLFNIDLLIISHRMEKLAAPTFFISERIRIAGYVQTHSLEDELKAITDWYLLQKKKK